MFYVYNGLLVPSTLTLDVFYNTSSKRTENNGIFQTEVCGFLINETVFNQCYAEAPTEH